MGQRFRLHDKQISLVNHSSPWMMESFRRERARDCVRSIFFFHSSYFRIEWIAVMVNVGVDSPQKEEKQKKRRNW